MIGKTVSNYKIQSVIGSGGMGKVYLAKQFTIDREVAIKILDPSLSGNPQFRERFINEANALAKLSHPNIVSIYDFIEFEGNYCIVMEYVNGITLDAMIDKNGKIDMPFATDIICQVLDGLSYAHKKSIVHRDIKPSNIIVDNDNRVKILDFGIAKIVLSNSNLTRTGMRMGSISYMSPEQILGKELDLKTDIYSAGVTFYEILSGKLPYDTNTDSDFIVQNKIVNEILPDIRSCNSSVTQNVAEAIYIATQKNPADRFESCEEFKACVFGDKNFSNISKIQFESIRSERNKTQYINTGSSDKTVFLPNQNDIKKSTFKISNKGIVIGIILIAIMSLAGVFFKSENLKILSFKIVMEIKEIKHYQIIKLWIPENIIKQFLIKKSQNLINSWINDINNKDLDYNNYYADKVNYYKTGVVSLSKVIKDKTDFFNKWDKIELRSEQFDFFKISNDEFAVTFDKYFNVDNYSTNKTYNGKVKSRMVFKEVNGELRIISETDDYTYYTNKNF
ncbi:MAG: serine/threonine protein kinase [Ignavibacteria bacterium]|nr:serine/threonine protein kinase [Ignavibacteria bacterium]